MRWQAAALRWFAVWLLLTAVFALGLALCRRIMGAALFSRDDLLYLAAVPLAQVAALAALAWTDPRRFKR